MRIGFSTDREPWNRVALHERDLEEVCRTVPEATVDLVPFGTDTVYFHHVPVEKQQGVLVFHSHVGYAPDIEAAFEFANDTFPLIPGKMPTAGSHLVGASPGREVRPLASRPGVRVSADLPDFRAAVCSGQLCVSGIANGTVSSL